MPSYTPGSLRIKVNSSSRQGFQMVDLSCLLEAFEVNRAIELATCAEQVFGSHRRPASAGKFASVMRHWVSQWKANPALYFFSSADISEYYQAIKNLRASWYQQFNPADQDGPNVGTLNDYWAAFITAMGRLGKLPGGMPDIDYGSLGADASLTSNALKQSEKTLVALADAKYISPSVSVEKDSFTDKLLEPISLSLSTEEYLVEYQHRLQTAHDAFLGCAVKEMNEFVALAADGERLAASVDYQAILDIAGAKGGGFCAFKDPSHGVNFFQPGHPNCLANLLALIKHEMDGIPRLHSKVVGGRKDRKTVTEGPSHWRNVQRYGIYSLLPYLGLMTVEALTALLVILLIENPRLNVESLITARYEDAYGNLALLSSAGDSDDTRLTVDKPRAHTQKSVILAGNSKKAVECLIAWTAPLREVLKKTGHPDAGRLCLFMGRDYNIAALTPNSAWDSFKRPSRGAGDKGRIPFMERHPELKLWAERATMASLRVSAGVLIWLKSEGDTEQVRLAFGHDDGRVTLNNYIPRQIQACMHERMIRRFQNLLIISACAGKSYMLEASDFSTPEELHVFLSGMMESPQGQQGNPLIDHIRERLGSSTAKIRPITPEQPGEQAEVYWNLSVDGLAILRLYREHLLALDLPQSALDQQDGQSGTNPQFWLDLGNIVAAIDRDGIPDEYAEFGGVFRESIQRAAELRGKIQFPDLQVA